MEELRNQIINNQTFGPPFVVNSLCEWMRQLVNAETSALPLLWILAIMSLMYMYLMTMLQACISSPSSATDVATNMLYLSPSNSFLTSILSRACIPAWGTRSKPAMLKSVSQHIVLGLHAVCSQ